jgi:chemotaxis protein MotB
LSAARSIALLELFSTRYEVARERMSITGYADTAPVDTNDTAEGRTRNRRCDILILNETGMLGEPESHGTPGTGKPSAVRRQM